MEWDIFSLCVWDRAIAADGMTQNEFLSRLWPFKHELLEWACLHSTVRLFLLSSALDPDDVHFPWVYQCILWLQTQNQFTVVLLKQVRVYFEIL